jgi:hypothetical protein
MVATVTVVEITGAGPAYTTITNRVRLFTADQATTQAAPQTTYPVPIPAASFNYSYWKAVALQLAGSGFTITNIRHYGTGSATGWTYGTGGALLRGAHDAGDQGVASGGESGVTAYQQAAGTQGTTGYYIGVAVNGHASYLGQTTPTVDAAADTSGSPCVIDNTTTYTAAGYTKHIVLQVKVDTAANGSVQGTQTAYTFTWKYDEA